MHPTPRTTPNRRPTRAPALASAIIALAGLAATTAPTAAQEAITERPDASEQNLIDLRRAARIADPEVRRAEFGDDIDARLREAGLSPAGGFNRQPADQAGGAQRPRSFVNPAETRAQQEAEAQAQQEAQDAADSAVSDDGETISLAAFTDPVELSLLLSIAAETLGINMTVDQELAGTVKFNAPIEVTREEFLPLIDALLQPRGFTIVQDDTGWYTVRRSADIPLIRSNNDTTRIVRTLNVRPTIIEPVLTAQLNDASVRKTALDELGVIILTGPRRSLDVAESFIDDILEERTRLRFERIGLEFISAPVARDRAIELLSGATASNPAAAAVRANPNQANPNAAGASAGGSLTNLADRLRLDQGDNALLFLGLPEELEEVREVIQLIDVASSLEPVRYRTGTATSNIAQIAQSQGLGTVIELADTTGPGGAINPGVVQAQRQAQVGQLGQQQSTSTGGSRLIVDAARGYIVYYGTTAQQKRLAELVEQFEVSDELITIRAYRLQYAAAEDVEPLLVALIRNQTPAGDDGGGFLLPQGQQQQQQRQQIPELGSEGLGSDDISANFDQQQTFVVADESQNQIFVKAPQRQQREFARLIQRLDIRRPQVYIEARIVTVTITDDLDYGFETNLFELFNSNFSAASNFGGVGGNPFGTIGAIGPGSGFTGVVLNPRQVPILIQAVQTDSRARTLAIPSLLVDDNEEASIQTVSEEPTTTANQGAQTTEIAFAGFEEAGTTLTVEPQITEGGLVRLNYDIEQSSFVGEGTDILPPGRLTNNISSESVTVPSGSTVIIGGLNTDANSSTVVKVPLLGDIPLLGELFKDTSIGTTRQRLYVFLTPRILTEPTIEDYRLLTAPAIADAKLPGDEPTLEPTLIPIRVPATLQDLTLEDILTEQQAKDLGLSPADTTASK